MYPFQLFKYYMTFLFDTFWRLDSFCIPEGRAIQYFPKELQHFKIIFFLEPLDLGWQPQAMVKIVTVNRPESSLGQLGGAGKN